MKVLTPVLPQPLLHKPDKPGYTLPLKDEYSETCL